MSADQTTSANPGATYGATPSPTGATKPMAERQRYLSIEEAATYLNVSVRFLRRLVCDRRVRYYKVGKFVRFDPTDLDAFAMVNEPTARLGADPALTTDVWRRGRRSS